MKPGQKLWSREELILAINQYCKLPFGRLHSRNPDVIRHAKVNYDFSCFITGIDNPNYWWQVTLNPGAWIASID